MNEENPANPYMQEHPQAIEDPYKAEIMAYASHEQEEAVVKARAEALGHAALIGDSRYHDAEYEGRQAVQRAGEARKIADEKANQAASIYDAVKHL